MLSGVAGIFKNKSQNPRHSCVCVQKNPPKKPDSFISYIWNDVHVRILIQIITYIRIIGFPLFFLQPPFLFDWNTVIPKCLKKHHNLSSFCISYTCTFSFWLKQLWKLNRRKDKRKPPPQDKMHGRKGRERKSFQMTPHRSVSSTVCSPNDIRQSSN